MDYKSEFLKLYRQFITRDGSEELLQRIIKSDFFTAPASTRFHDSHEGGLVKHSVRVFDFLERELPDSFDCSGESMAIVSLLHDVCKIGYYTTEMRNKKDEHGRWVQVPFYTVDDQFPYGHGDKSVFLIERCMKLTEEEAIAIRLHMGAYEGERMWGTIGTAFEKYPLSLYLHVADMKATYLK